MQSKNFEKYNLEGLQPLMYETLDEEDKYVIVADQSIGFNDLKKATL